MHGNGTNSPNGSSVDEMAAGRTPSPNGPSAKSPSPNGPASKSPMPNESVVDGTAARYVADEADDFTLVRYNRRETPNRYVCAICEEASFAEAGLALRHAVECKTQRRPPRTADPIANDQNPTPSTLDDDDDGDNATYILNQSDDEDDVFRVPTKLLKRRQIVKFLKSHNGKRTIDAEDTIFHCLAYHQTKVDRQKNRNKAHRAAVKRGREMAEAWYATHEREVIVPRKENIPRLRELAAAHGADICILRARPDDDHKEIVAPIDFDSPEVVHAFYHEGRYHYVTDRARFVAPNRCRHCGENMPDINLSRHELNCGYQQATKSGHSTGPTKVTHSKLLRKFKPPKTLFEKLQKEGVLVDVKTEHFDLVHVVYDIETLAKEECVYEGDNLDRQTFPTGKHGIYHVSVSLHMGNEVYVGAIRSDDLAPGEQFGRAFACYLLRLQEMTYSYKKNKLAGVVHELSGVLEAHESKGDEFQAKRVRGVIEEIDQYCQKLLVGGWNSSGFDLPILMGDSFVYWLDRLDGRPSAVRKFNSYLLMESPKIRLVDFMNYFSGKMPLRKLLATFDVRAQKSYFPHEVLKTLDDLKRPVEELTTADFHSRLSNANTLEEGGKGADTQLTELKQEWRELGIETIQDLTVHYAFFDVVPLGECMVQMMEKYVREFDVPPDVMYTFCTLPGLSLAYTMKNLATEASFPILPEGIYDALREGIMGGYTAVFNRHHQVDHTTVGAATEDQTGLLEELDQLVKNICGFDANALYSCAMCDELFYGLFVVRHKEDHYAPQFVGKKGKTNLSLVWLKWCSIRHGLDIAHLGNGGEQKLYLKDKRVVYVDGYATKRHGRDGKWTKRYAFEYLGCGTNHGWCPDCRTPAKDALIASGGATHGQLREETFERFRLIQAAHWNIKIEYIWDCQFKQMITDDDDVKAVAAEYQFGPKIHKEKYDNEKGVIADVLFGKIHGIMRLKCAIPMDLWEEFEAWPPFYNRLTIDNSMRSEYVKKYQTEYGLKGTSATTLASSFFFNGTMTTSAFKFYTKLVWGRFAKNVETWDVEWVVEFERGHILKPYIEKMLEKRREADDNNQVVIGEIVKTLLNSSYGKSIMNLSKLKSDNIVDKAKFNKVAAKGNYVASFPIGPNDDRDALSMVTTTKKSARMNLPYQLGYCILWNSKIRVLDYVYNYLLKSVDHDKSKLEFVYTDTDSVYYALTKPTLEECVPDHLKEEHRRLKEKYEVNSWGTKADFDKTKRAVGKWKLEAELSRMVCLSAKVYCGDKVDGGKKASLRGTVKSQNRDNIRTERYHEVLTEQTGPLSLTNKGMRTARGQVYNYETTKRALCGGNYLKRAVLDDGIHTEALEMMIRRRLREERGGDVTMQDVWNEYFKATPSPKGGPKSIAQMDREVAELESNREGERRPVDPVLDFYRRLQEEKDEETEARRIIDDVGLRAMTEAAAQAGRDYDRTAEDGDDEGSDDDEIIAPPRRAERRLISDEDDDDPTSPPPQKSPEFDTTIAWKKMDGGTPADPNRASCSHYWVPTERREPIPPAPRFPERAKKWTTPASRPSEGRRASVGESSVDRTAPGYDSSIDEPTKGDEFTIDDSPAARQPVRKGKKRRREEDEPRVAVKSKKKNPFVLEEAELSGSDSGDEVDYVPDQRDLDFIDDRLVDEIDEDDYVDNYLRGPHLDSDSD